MSSTERLELIQQALLALALKDGTAVSSAVRRSLQSCDGLKFDWREEPWFSLAEKSPNDPAYLDARHAPGLIVLWDIGMSNPDRSGRDANPEVERARRFYFDLTDLPVRSSPTVTVFFFSHASLPGVGLTRFDKPRFDLIHLGFPFDSVEAAATVGLLFSERKVRIENDWFLRDRIPELGGDPEDLSLSAFRRTP